MLLARYHVLNLTTSVDLHRPQIQLYTIDVHDIGKDSQRENVEKSEVSGAGSTNFGILLRLPTTSYYFLLLPAAPSVSCPCVDARLTRSSKLPPSPAFSRCLPMHIVYSPTTIPSCSQSSTRRVTMRVTTMRRQCRRCRQCPGEIRWRRPAVRDYRAKYSTCTNCQRLLVGKYQRW